ncbi:nucleophile aminohydrolase [Cyathus striatus]|nr:nucleophile aminohydrolase [Cyathus striatus]
MANSTYNFDGFGVTWYTKTRSRYDGETEGPRPTLYKTTAIPTTDQTFISLAANSASTCILAHVRAATRPPCVDVNSHPFIFGRHSFMHNGGITDFPKIRVALLEQINHDYGSMILGNTDTEHLAALYFTYLGDINKTYTAQEMRSAMAKAILKVQEVQRNVLGKERANSLNLCATDGENLVAIRWRNNPDPTQPPDRNPPSLYVSYNAGASLNRNHKEDYNADKTEVPAQEVTESAEPASEKKGQFTDFNPHGPHVIIASEPATYVKDQWWHLKNGEFIIVERHDLVHKRHKEGVEGLDIVQEGESETHRSVLHQDWGVRITFDTLDTSKVQM